MTAPPLTASNADRLASSAVAIGICVAASASLLFAGAALPVDASGGRMLLFTLACGAGVGILVGGRLAWSFADGAVRPGSGRDVVWSVSGRAVLQGSLLVAILMVVGSASWGRDLDRMTIGQVVPKLIEPVIGGGLFLLMIWLIGVLVFGAPALIAIVPLVVLWAAIVRRFAPSARIRPRTVVSPITSAGS